MAQELRPFHLDGTASIMRGRRTDAPQWPCRTRWRAAARIAASWCRRTRKLGTRCATALCFQYFTRQVSMTSSSARANSDPICMASASTSTVSMPDWAWQLSSLSSSEAGSMMATRTVFPCIHTRPMASVTDSLAPIMATGMCTGSTLFVSFRAATSVTAHTSPTQVSAWIRDAAQCPRNTMGKSSPLFEELARSPT